MSKRKRNFFKQGGPLSITYEDNDSDIQELMFAHLRPGGASDNKRRPTKDDGELILEDQNNDPVSIKDLVTNFVSLTENKEGDIELKDDLVSLENRNEAINMAELFQNSLPVRDIITSGHLIQMGRTEMIYQSNTSENDGNVTVNSFVEDTQFMSKNEYRREEFTISDDDVVVIPKSTKGYGYSDIEEKYGSYVYDLNSALTKEVTSYVQIQPVSGYFSIKGLTNNYDIQILNSMGQIVQSINSAEDVTVDITDLSSGLFFISVKNKTNSKVWLQLILKE